MQLICDQNNMRNIIAKLRNANTQLQGQHGAGQKIKFNWIVRMLNIYTTGVTQAMGSVVGAGDYMKIAFFDARGQEYWKNLAPYTLKQKALRSSYNGDMEYDALKWEFSIWKDTGETAREMYSSSRQSAQSMNFAGITNINSKILERARRMEFGERSQTGKSLPPRALFAVANRVFLDAMHKLFTSGSSNPLVEQLRQEVINDLFVKKVGWGKGSLEKVGGLYYREYDYLNTITGTVGHPKEKDY